MTLNEIPAWSDIESQPWFAELTPEEKQQSLTKWQGDMMQFAKDPKEKFAVAATSKAKARSFFGEEMPDDPIADALQRRQKDLEDIGSRYDAFSKGELKEDDEEVLTLNDTLKGNTPYSVIKGRLFVSPQLVWDKAAYEKVVNEAPVDEDERVLAMSAYDGSKERAAEGVVNSLGYTDEEFRDFAAKGFKEGKSNAAILDEWKANNKLPEGILGSLRGVGRQAYFGLRSGLSGLERAMGGLGGFFGSESAQKYAEESGKEAQSYMQRTLGEGPEFIGELTSGAVSIIPTIAAGAAASFFTEGAALPAAASITAGAIQSAGATQAETYEFYRNQGLDHANALAESRVDGLVSGLITGAITHYAGKLGDKIGLGKGIEGLFSGPASKIASKLTQREISESLKAGAKAVGGSFLQEGSEELLDQAAQDAYSMIKRDPTLTLAEAINNALQAGKVGAVLGGAAEAGKIGLNSLLNSAKFAVPTTEEEEALRAKFEVPATVEEEVIASPEVQQEEQNVKTAADVVKETAPVAPQTAAVLAGITEEKAGELAADVVVKTGDALATIEAEAPVVATEPPAEEAPPPAEAPAISPKPPVSPAVEPAPIGETQPPQGQPVETPTNALPISPATPSLPREERPEMGLQQVGEGNAQPEKVAETRSEEEVVVQKVFSALQRHLGSGGEFQIPGNPPVRVTKKNIGQFSVSEDGSLVFSRGKKGGKIPLPDVAVIGAQVGAPFDVLSLFSDENVAPAPVRSSALAVAESDNGSAFDRLVSLVGDRGKASEEIEILTSKDVFSAWPVLTDVVADSVAIQKGQDVDTQAKADALRKLYREAADLPPSKERADALEQIRLAASLNITNEETLKRRKKSPPTTGAVPPKTLPAGQKVTPRGVASPGVAAEAAPEPAPAVEPAPEAQPEQPSVKATPEGKRSLYQIRAAEGRSATDADGVPTGWKLNEFRDAIELVSEDASKYVVFPIENPSSYGDKLRALITAENWAIDNPVRAQLEAAPMEANYGAGRVEDVTPKTVKFVHTTKTTPGKGQKSGYYPGTYAYESESGLLPSMEGNKFVGELPESGIYTLKDADQLKKDAADAGFGRHSGNGNAEVKYLQSLGFKAMRRPATGGTEIIVFDAKDANFQPAPEARPVSQPVQAFRDAVSQMSPTAQAKWTPELRATAEAYLDSGGTTGLQGLSDVQQKVVGRYLPEEVKAAFDAEDARKRAQRNKLPDHRESSLPPTPGKQIRKIGNGAMESVPVVLDEIAKVIPNIRDLVEVRESAEGEPDAEGFYDPQADKAVVLVDNVYLKPQHGGSQEAALRETIIHELLHRGFAKLRQTNPQLFQQFEAFSITDTNDNLLDALVRRGYTMYSNWRNDPAQAQKAREEVFVRKAALDLAVNGLDAIKSPTSLASQFFKWFKEFLSKLLGRTPPENQLIHWTQIFLNAAQADFIEKTPGERSFSMGRDLLSPEKYARHAELEAKHNAGTITPEETAEAQALVEEAAKAAGFSTRGFHQTWSDFTAFKIDEDYSPDEFDQFIRDLVSPETVSGRSGRAFFFSSERGKKVAEHNRKKTGERTLDVWLKTKNPLILDEITWGWARDVFGNGKKEFPKTLTDEARARIEEEGYDGIFVYGPRADSSKDSVEEILVFSPSQIKSAERFTGVLLEQRFGPSPDIRYSLGEPPDMQEVKDRLNTFIDENKATNSFLEAFGPVRVERMQQQGEKLGPEYIQAQVRPLMQRAQAELGFEMDEEGSYVLSQRATDKAQGVLVKWLQDGRKFAKAYNKKAEKFFDKLFPGMEDIPVDSDMAAAVLLHEIMSYAKALAASSPKAEDQILLDMVRPQYGSVVLANYDQTMHKSGRTLQTARNYSEGTELGQDAVENANKKGEEKVTEELGDEALPSATEEGKVGLEAGVDAAPDISAPADPTLRLLDLAVESLDEVAKSQSERLFGLLLRRGRIADALERAKKAGNKALSILTEKTWLEEPLPSTIEELEAEAAKLDEQIGKALTETLKALEGAKPETRKKVKAVAAKTKSKTDSVQKLIDKLSKMPDESKEAKPKAETLRAAIADAIKEKKFDEQKVRDAATKFGATPEQTERLVEEAERLHEIAQDKTPSKTKLRKFLLSHPQETLYNPEQRQALVKTFLRNEVGMNDAEIARYLPKFESSFGKAMEDARKKYLDGLEKRFNAPKKARESRVDAQNRKLLQALRAGLAETKSPKVALLERLGFKEFKPTDKHVIAKLDAARTEALANGEFAKARLKQTELSSLLLRRRPPMGWMQLFNQAWITSALSSFRNLALNVWTPLGEAVSRYFGALAGALKTGDFTTVTALTKALGEAFRRFPARFKFAYSANTFTQQANAAIAEQASLIDEFRRSLSQLRDKKLSKKDRAKAATRVIFSFGDYSRRLLQTIDESWFSILESFISSANLTSDINKYGIKAEALTEASVRFATQAKNDAYAVSQIVDRLSDYLDGLKGKTTAEIQQALELYRMDQLGISPENLAFTNEMLDVIEQLRLRSGAEGDALLKAAKRNINDYRRLAWVRAAEKADADTREWVSAVLTGKGVEKVDVDQVLKDATEGSERAASYGMGLHRVEEAPALDIGNTFAKMVEAMGQQAIRVNPMLGRMMVGFFGIPVNLMNKSLWFAPGYGALRYFAFRKMAERHPEKQFYAYSLANEKERAQRFREVIFGHAVFGLLAALGAFDDRDEEETEGLYVTLGGPANKTEKDAWLSRGFRPYSICIKHADGSVTSIPYGVGAGEFMKMPLMAAGAFDDMRLNKKLGNREDMSSALEYFNAFAAGVGRQATFLGAKNTVGALLPDTFGAGTVANLAFAAGNFFPFNGLDRSLETLVSGPPDRSRTGAILANIPYLRHLDVLGARPATNVFGDPWGSKTADPIEIIEDRLLSQSISVWNTSKPLTGRDKKLYEFIGRYQVGPNGPQRGALELRNGYLTDQEWANYRDAWAANAKREWLSSLDRMARMDEDGRAKAAAELSTRASRKAKDRFNYK